MVIKEENPMKSRYVNLLSLLSPLIVLRQFFFSVLVIVVGTATGEKTHIFTLLLGGFIGYLGVFGGKGNKGFGLMGTDEGAIRGHIRAHWRHRQH